MEGEQSGSGNPQPPRRFSKDSSGTATVTNAVGPSPFRRDSLLGLEKRYEHTYKMEPDGYFPVDQVTQIVNEMLEEHLRVEKYEVNSARQMSLTLCEVIKKRVKELGKAIARYKLIVQVMIGQNKRQGMNIVSRSLWNQKSDRCASASILNDSLFAVGVVFGE